MSRPTTPPATPRYSTASRRPSSSSVRIPITLRAPRVNIGGLPCTFLPTLTRAVTAALSRLDTRLSPEVTIKRLQRHEWTWKGEAQYAFLAVLAVFCLNILPLGIMLKLGMVAAYVTVTLIPFTSQFFFPATPVLSWALLFFSCRFIPSSIRPHIWVSVLPTLESVLYGANISDILTRYSNSLLDLLAWFPYGVVHYVGPIVVSAVLFIFGPPGSIKFFAKALGYMNLTAVLTQILFPCAPPWYELIYGITPANYSMPGSPGGLARIDVLFHSNTYTSAFNASPLVFGAFPSLHAGWATMEALHLSHFFPRYKAFYWFYCLWLYWATMLLSHHYLIDLVAGGSLAVGCFYFFLTDEMRHAPVLAGAPVTSREMPMGLNEALINGDAGNGYAYGLEDEEDDDVEMGKIGGGRKYGVHETDVGGNGGTGRRDSATPFLSEAVELESQRGKGFKGAWMGSGSGRATPTVGGKGSKPGSRSASPAPGR